jgi:hypothetical protein
MLQYILDAPVHSLLILPSVIVQAQVIRLAIDLYKNKPLEDTRRRQLLALFLTGASILVCIWQAAPYRNPLDFPAVGSTLRFERANHLTEEPASFYITAEDTQSPEKMSYVITFRDDLSGQPVLQAYLKSGQGAKILVPPGDFSVAVEQGHRWFGPKQLFMPKGEPIPSPGVVRVKPGSTNNLHIGVSPRPQPLRAPEIWLH